MENLNSFFFFCYILEMLSVFYSTTQFRYYIFIRNSVPDLYIHFTRFTVEEVDLYTKLF